MLRIGKGRRRQKEKKALAWGIARDVWHDLITFKEADLDISHYLSAIDEFSRQFALLLSARGSVAPGGAASWDFSRAVLHRRVRSSFQQCRLTVVFCVYASSPGTDDSLFIPSLPTAHHPLPIG
jgi:hypothetical protein